MAYTTVLPFPTFYAVNDKSLEESAPAVMFQHSIYIMLWLLSVFTASFAYFLVTRIQHSATEEPRNTNPSLTKRLRLTNIVTNKPRRYRPWKAGPYHMMMALRKMEDRDWLLVDNRYLPEQQFRRDLLATNRNGVMQILPGMDDICEELLETVVDFLVGRYPEYFQLVRDKGYIYNMITDERVKVVKPWDRHPLEIAALLVMEDINLLVQGNDGEHYLRASFTMAPAGWDLRERIGWPLHKMHELVPGWERTLRKRIGSTLFQPHALAESLLERPRAEDIYVRAERQTLKRLSRSKAIVFMVHLLDEKENLESLRSAVRAWPDDLGRYKGRDVWGRVFEEWCDEVLEKNEPEPVDFPLIEEPGRGGS
ncbi:hypothetical protein ACMFMF_005766 [Clarireedia jacksonii]